MDYSLVQCPACSRQVSAAARSCVQCGHPLKSSVVSSKGVLALLMAGLLSITGLAAYKLDMHAGLFEVKSKATPVSYTEQVAAAPRMSEKELAVELQAFALRANRTLPHRPNPMLTLERISYKPKPHRLTYDYELNVAARSNGVDLENVRPALMRRYCQEETFQLASNNGVAVTWRYLDLGRVVHQETIHRCEANQIAGY